jgi:hypothetical protein
MTHAEIADAARRADLPWIEGLARYGLVAKGASYVLVGVLAGLLAAGAGGTATSREGALHVIADEWWGTLVLVLLMLGFAAYCLWRLLQAIFDREHEGSDLEGLAKRAGYVGRAAIYAVLTYSTVRLLADAGSGDESQTGKARKATAQVLDWPAGRWLVALAGVALIGAGLVNGYRAFTQSFDEKWDTQRMSAAEQRWGRRIGAIGLLARLVVFGLIGAFLIKAAAEYEPQEAVGLDGALRRVAEAPYGPVLLGTVALGLLCYGTYCFVEARYRRV